MKEKFFITTPIYYPSDKLHIGHTYCTVATDAIARYKRLCGYDVMFLTGTDEHGQKIEEKAKAAGKTPKEFVDDIVEGVNGQGGIRQLWKLMNISNDRFIRTTDDYHVESVQKIFRKMFDNGDIYKGAYKGLYCTPCESFWTESQLVDGKCPDCGREVKYAEEEAYFFRASKYADKVRELLLTPGFLEPQSRVNEMINNFIDCEGGLQDLCVSRTSFSWGIPVDFDPGHVVYVWLDALFNYVTALGYCNEKYDDLDKFWPGVNIVGKEIVRFHSIYWPAFLMSVGLPVPKKVFGHGWLLLDGGKMSKSKGNVVDPYVLAERYGVDSLRYFLLREFPFGSDGSFSNELLITRINTDLANDFGNLVSRSVAMIGKYFGGKLPNFTSCDTEDCDKELIALASGLRDRYEEKMDVFALQPAFAEVFKVISRANKYIDETQPWVLAKDEANKNRLAQVLYNLLEAIRICASLLSPVIPDSAEKALDQIGAPNHQRTWDTLNTWGVLAHDTAVNKGEVLFPRIDMAKELEVLDNLNKKPQPAADPVLPDVTIDQFAACDLRVCKILACENVAKSEKLLKFSLDDGSGQPRQILSGIAKYYKPEQLIGKTVVAILNLPTRKMMGLDSNGMLISAEKDGKLNLLTLPDEIPAGAKIC